MKVFPNLFIISESTTIEKFIQNIRLDPPDIAILDVEVEDGNSLDEVLGQEEILCRSEVIMMSSSIPKNLNEKIEHMSSFIKKPIDLENLFKALYLAMSNLFDGSGVNKLKSADPVKTEVLGVSGINRIEVVCKNHIEYLQADGRYTYLYFKDKSRIIATRSLGDFEKRLETNKFIRIHNSFIVNFLFAKTIIREKGYSLEMLNGEHLPISRRRISAIRLFLGL